MIRTTLPVIIMATVGSIWLFAAFHLHPPGGARRFVRRVTASSPRGSRVPHPPPPSDPPSPRGPTGAATNATTERRREMVVAAMRHSWAGYKKYAWGHDELTPLTRGWVDWDCAGHCHLCLTIIDALDTLWVMGLKDEFREAMNYVAHNLTFHLDMKVSVFETIIRFLGGLLSAYDLSGDRVLLRRAVELADRLLRAWSDGGPFPLPLVNLKTGMTDSWHWTGNRILAEVASLQLEFRYLSRRTNNSAYDDRGTAILRAINAHSGELDGLAPTMLLPSGGFASSRVSIGAFGDSYYEYLLKLWVYDGDRLALGMFRAAAAAIRRRMLLRTPRGVGIGVLDGGNVAPEMEHLTCFAGGMLALAHYYGVGDGGDLALAEAIAAYCHFLHTTATGLPPDTVTVQPDGAFHVRDGKYILRPETVETYFYLWRVTKKPIYRDWGWELMEACDLHLKVETGYAGARNVESVTEPLMDKMESFWLAETLKYLYLLFSDDSVLSLDDYVFNTEAHPVRRLRKARPP